MLSLKVQNKELDCYLPSDSFKDEEVSSEIFFKPLFFHFCAG